MNYSIIISPITQNSNAIEQALNFVNALISKKHHVISIFFYGHAVKHAFIEDSNWNKLAEIGIPLMACSTISETLINKQQKLSEHFTLAGLGQWMESVANADKNIEFS